MAEKQIVKISDITKFGDSLAKSIRANLRSVTKKLGGSGMVKLTNATSRGGNTSINILIGDGKKDPNSLTQPITGLIRAVEGGAKAHVIAPRKGKYLAFKWPGVTPHRGKVAKKYVGKLSDGRLLFNYVDHPGMKGFHPIRKSIETTLRKATPELKASIRKNVVDMLNITIREINRK